MSSSLIVLQPERYIKLGPGLSLTQSSLMAVDIRQYQFITPFVRVLRSVDNSLSPTGVRFTFKTAALVSSTDDEEVRGVRFVAMTTASDFKVDVTPTAAIVGSGSNGATFGPGIVASTGIVNALQNLGGLLIWSCQNLEIMTTNVLSFELHLVCRGR